MPKVFNFHETDQSCRHCLNRFRASWDQGLAKAIDGVNR
ncbi:hypothetical protein ADICYQ_3686 [Cyclobacterium qasimii M12-11B]|uniref:Uncharacterized protein n=1 Tax=Cyclobacterium qasimii M12-11B TaxID=641524 RepID=S7VAP6_9BACT|nr:hypothetical protein ADICYQ_3686 [Cyclobacterium qasimii M12-11B]